MIASSSAHLQDHPPNICIVLQYARNGDLANMLYHRDLEENAETMPWLELTWTHPLLDIALDHDVDIEGACGGEAFLEWKAAGQIVRAVSRWRDAAGEGWRPCTVLDYDAGTSKFLIEWDGTGATKYVGRLNLIFATEDRRAFEHAVARARQTR